MMVGDGSSGNRQVRIELQDDALPGVSITVQQIDGRLQVDFVCSNEQSRLQLNRATPNLANQLADRLKQDVLVRVQTDDDEDLCLYEIVGTAFT
jgi:flagellar hook-length control protein FliK